MSDWKKFPIMSMRPGDTVVVTGYHADPYAIGTFIGANRQHGWTVTLKVDGEDRSYDLDGDRPHRFWR